MRFFLLSRYAVKESGTRALIGRLLHAGRTAVNSPSLFSIIEPHGTRADVLLLFMASGMLYRRYVQNLFLHRFQSHDQVCCFNI